jgi:hypothetical protein
MPVVVLPFLPVMKEPEQLQGLGQLPEPMRQTRTMKQVERGLVILL